MPSTYSSCDDAPSDHVIGHLEPMQQAGSVLLDALRGPDLIGKLQALQHRLENGVSTPEDRSLLARLPACHLTPDELVSAFVRVEQSIPQRPQA